MEEISRQLQNLTDQLNRFQPASEHTVGVAQGQVPAQLQKKFYAQTERMDQLTATVVESQKSAQTNSEVLQNLLVRIENFRENFKTMQAEMIAWQEEYQNAEGEYQRMNAELLQEVPLASKAELKPGPANPPTVSFPPIISTQFTVPAVISTPQSSGQTMEAEIQARWANLSALKKSYLGAPPPANWVPKGMNVSKFAVQDSQATIPQFFNFVGSSSGMPQLIVQPPATMEKNTSIFNLPQTVGFPPTLLDTYSQQRKEMRGTTKPQPTVSEQENSMQDAEQYSGTEISFGEAARIRDEVQGVMQ